MRALKATGDVLHPGKAWIIFSDEDPTGYWHNSHLDNRKNTLIKQGYTIEEIEIEDKDIPPEGRRYPNSWLVDA